MLTFEQFQATGRDSADLSEVLDECVDGPGRVYLVTDTGALYIHRWGGSAGEWCVVLGNEQIVCEKLADAERALYSWAIGEGYTLTDSELARRDALQAERAALDEAASFERGLYLGNTTRDPSDMEEAEQALEEWDEENGDELRALTGEVEE
jgi:hypothetical protein